MVFCQPEESLSWTELFVEMTSAQSGGIERYQNFLLCPLLTQLKVTEVPH